MNAVCMRDPVNKVIYRDALFDSSLKKTRESGEKEKGATGCVWGSKESIFVAKRRILSSLIHQSVTVRPFLIGKKDR